MGCHRSRVTGPGRKNGEAPGKVSGGRDTNYMGSSKVRNKAVALALPIENTVRPLSPSIKQLYDSSLDWLI
jgi:hypothetical protein